MRIGITGASGLIGSALSRRLGEAGHAVVNRAGAGIGNHRWTDEYKRRITDSRVRGTALIAHALASSVGPRVLLNASAVGYYGNGEQPVDETAPPGNDFLAGVVAAWEAATVPAEQAGVRVARMRSGIVLSAHGGALEPMLPIFKLAVGDASGAAGNG